MKASVTKESPLSFSVGGCTVRGHWHHPMDESNRGIVMLHGYAGYSIGPHRLFVHFARMAARSGWHVFRFDFRGRGHSDTPARVDQDSMIQDALAGCRIFSRSARLNHLAVLGLCSGGVLALAIADHIPIDQLVLWSPDIIQADTVRTRHLVHVFLGRVQAHSAKLCKGGTWRKLLRGEVDFSAVSSDLRDSFDRRNGSSSSQWLQHALAELQRKKNEPERQLAPILYAYGRSDETASVSWPIYHSYMKDTERSYRVVWIEGANHNFYAIEGRDALLAATLEFLDRNACAMPH